MTRSRTRIYEEFLVLETQRGSSEAFDRLVRQVQPSLLAHARRLSGPEVALDVTQDAWLAIARGIRRLDDPARFRGWALRIVSRSCADALSSSRRRREREEAAAEERRRDGGEECDDLSELLVILPPDERAVLSLYYLERFSVKEIAEVLEIPKGTVKSRLYRARESCREILQRRTS